MKKRHSEIAFIPMNIGRRGRPWFAIVALCWTAAEARRAMTKNDPRDHDEAWKLLRMDGWRVVKVRVTEL